jgi:hypothetical protein
MGAPHGAGPPAGPVLLFGALLVLALHISPSGAAHGSAGAGAGFALAPPLAGPAATLQGAAPAGAPASALSLAGDAVTDGDLLGAPGLTLPVPSQAPVMRGAPAPPHLPACCLGPA